MMRPGPVSAHLDASKWQETVQLRQPIAGDPGCQAQGPLPGLSRRASVLTSQLIKVEGPVWWQHSPHPGVQLRR